MGSCHQLEHVLSGKTVPSLAFYQLGAKVHEISAQASLAAIVFTYVRHEMLLGQGLPLGALFSGLQVSQASYLWSMEYWGLICSKNFSLRKRLCMILVITIAVILAATVGPSSAILLIPRLEYWPAGSTDIWLNATFQELWPDHMNGSLVPTSCHVLNISPGDYRRPASGWQGIETYLSIGKNLEPFYFLEQYGVAGPTVEIPGKSSLRSLDIRVQGPSNYGSDPAEDPQPMGAISQKSAVADALSTTARLWTIALDNVTTSGHGSALNQLDAIHSIESGYYQPYTLTSCEYDVIRGPKDHSLVGFPPPPGSYQVNGPHYNDSILYGISEGINVSRDAIVFPGLTKAEILMTPGPLSENRLKWVELPQDGFNSSTIGAVVLSPRSSGDGNQEILMCTVCAGWGTSKLNVSTSLGVPNTVLSEPTLKDNNYSVAGPGAWDVTRKESAFQGLQAEQASGFYGYPFFPQRQVTVNEDWAEYLNPSITGLNTTVFHHLMTSGSTVLGDAQVASVVLTSLMANGLANIGSTSHIQGDLKMINNSDGSTSIDGQYWFSGKGNVLTVDPVESKDWVKFHVYSSIEGYAYNTSGTPPKVAICILLLYCTFALAHTTYAVIYGVSSTCWDSIGEVTALAMNSTPTTLLRNTCAGISELKIFKLPVRVLAIRDDEGDGEHLELVFGDVDEKSVENKIIKKNRVYGTMAAQATHGKVL